MGKIPVYSPTQVAVAAFFGGPIATVYVLWKNFRALDNHAAAKKTLIWGAVFLVAILVALPVLPDKFPNFAIPLAYTIVARQIADKYQMSKRSILDSTSHDFQSNWNVLGVCVGFIVLFFAIAFAWFLILYAAGVAVD